MGWESSGVVGFDLIIDPRVLVHCLYGGYNLHWFSDALGLVIKLFCFNTSSLHTFLFRRYYFLYLSIIWTLI